MLLCIVTGILTCEMDSEPETSRVSIHLNSNAPRIGTEVGTDNVKVKLLVDVKDVSK